LKYNVNIKEAEFLTRLINFHFFTYDREKSTISYIHTEGVESRTMAQNTPFKDFTSERYNSRYRKNHYHKNKGLPIYVWEDIDLFVKLKNKMNKFRDVLLHIVLKLK